MLTSELDNRKHPQDVHDAASSEFTPHWPAVYVRLEAPARALALARLRLGHARLPFPFATARRSAELGAPAAEEEEKHEDEREGYGECAEDDSDERACVELVRRV